jgi:tetratricopeptide (TPR) repeat protein
MSFRFLISFFGFSASAVCLWGQSEPALSGPQAPDPEIDLAAFLDADAGDPDVDPFQIINESMNFRKEREPDMTAAEFALYERMSTMVETNAAFALQLLETMLGDAEEDSAAFDLALGNLYYAEQRIDEALERYHSAVEKYPEFLRGWSNIGMIHYQREEWTEAASAFAKAVNLGDRDAQTFGLLAFSMRQSGNTLAAEMAFMQAMTANPEDPNWIGGLLELYFSNGRHAQSESLVREMVRIEPQNASHWMLYASLLVTLERPLEAATQLEIARQLGVADRASLTLLGDLYVNLGLVPEAITAYEAIGEDVEELGQARLIGYTRSLISEGKLGEAKVILEKLPVASIWNHVRARHFAEAELATAKGEWATARQAYEAVLETEPLNAFALLGLGQSLREMGEPDRAVFVFESALQVSESERRACLELANLALADRRFDRAIEYLNRADRLESSSAVRSQIARLQSLARSAL